MVNEKAGEIEDKRLGLLEPISPYDKWKNTQGPMINYLTTMPCPKCGKQIPKTFYFHKECGWEREHI